MENTRLLQKLAELSKSQYELETALEQSQSTVVGLSLWHDISHIQISEYSGAQKKEQLEGHRLRDQIEANEKSIQAFKAEIERLQRKGSIHSTTSID